MNYIIAEQFLELPRKVQKIFIDWWEIKEGDLIYLVDEKETHSIIKTELDMYKLTHYWYYDNDRDELMMTSKAYDDGYPTIPLFRLDQLWEFINTRYKHIGVNNYLPMYVVNETTKATSLTIGDYEWDVKLFKSMKQFEPDIEVMKKDLLQSFWKAAVIVAEEIGGKNDEL